MLEKFKERLWIPYQVGYEYVRNRDRVIESVQESLSKINEEITKHLKLSKNELQKVDKKDIKCKEKIIEEIDKLNKKIEGMIEEEKKEQENFTKEDVVLEKILELYDGKCGEDASIEKQKEIKEEAQRREKNKIPPGYMDNNKEENYGDYYIFYSIIEKAKREKKDVIFVTDDEKEDWYLIKNGKKLGGRRELLQEFYVETNHQLLLITNTKRFVNDYSKYCDRTKQEIKTIIDEIEDVRQKEQTEEEKKNRYKSDAVYKYRSIKNIEKELLLDKIERMENLLHKMLVRRARTRIYSDEVKIIAKSILEDMRYEKYHGKMLIIIDELEKNSYMLISAYKCIDILEYIKKQLNV